MEVVNTAEARLIAAAQLRGLPVSGTLELSPLCTMDCGMCYVRLSPEELAAQGRLRTAEEWLSLIPQLRDAGVIFLLVTGGEPLLYPGFRTVWKALKDAGMVVSLNTNGTLINEDWAAFFKEYRPRRVNITVYGRDAETYGRICRAESGFARTLNGIRLLKEAGIDVKLNGSLVPGNAGQVDALEDLAQQLGCPMHIDTYMQACTRERLSPYCTEDRLPPEEAAAYALAVLRREKTPEELQAHIREITGLVLKTETAPPEEYTGMSCRAGSTSFAVNWQGKLFPCVMFAESAGDVFKDGFAPCWENLKQKCAAVRLSDRCSSCRYRRICATCAACARNDCGRTDAVPEYACAYTERLYALLQAEEER